MRSLYLRIYLTVLLALGLFALVSGWLLQRHFEHERQMFVASAPQRVVAWAELLQQALPGADAPAEEQAAALRDWSARLRLPLALDDAAGRRIAAADSWLAREAGAVPGAQRSQAIRLDDGRTLWMMRPVLRRGPPGAPRTGDDALPWWPLRGLPEGVGAGRAAAGAVRRGGGGGLSRGSAADAPARIAEAGRRGLRRRCVARARGRGRARTEVAALGASFNLAAGRIEALLRSHQSLLANASHELRSPLARLKMAVSLLEDTPAAERPVLQQEIAANIAELDALVEEVLMASRLDATPSDDRQAAVELLPLAAEEAARVQADLASRVAG